MQYYSSGGVDCCWLCELFYLHKLYHSTIVIFTQIVNFTVLTNL